MQKVLLLLFTLFLFCSYQLPPPTTGNSGFAVIELFTSEGCSSCPPADELLQRLQSEYHNQPVYLLSFHVDYWNHLGWKDPFSNAQYSSRQRWYAGLLHSQVYTPQAVINGSHEMVGSQTGNLHNTINASLKNKTEAGLKLFLKSKNNSLLIKYQLEKPLNGQLLNIAVAQSKASNKVNAGENSGHQLSHINVVRYFKTITSTQSEGEVPVVLPSGSSINEFVFIGYTQQQKGGQITSAGLTASHE